MPLYTGNRLHYWFTKSLKIHLHIVCANFFKTDMEVLRKVDVRWKWNWENLHYRKRQNVIHSSSLDMNTPPTYTPPHPTPLCIPKHSHAYGTGKGHKSTCPPLKSLKIDKSPPHVSILVCHCILVIFRLNYWFIKSLKVHLYLVSANYFLLISKYFVN